jgi:micrococcal nuclease
VVRVVDGDTIVIDRGRGNERLRYIGIDTPESVKPDTPVEYMAEEAAAANAALVEGRDVILEADISDRDGFDRLLRYVWLRDGDAWVFVNLELVRRGFAQVATYPPDVRWRDDLADAQRRAREAGAGLWGPATPAP